VVKDAAQVVPSAPGYSARMHDASLARFSFPDGGYWTERAATDTPVALVGAP
jgi:L-fuconate dehydratase